MPERLGLMAMLGQVPNLEVWSAVQAMRGKAAAPSDKYSPFLLYAGFLPLAKPGATHIRCQVPNLEV